MAERREVTTSEAARLLGVPAGAISDWRRRRDVMPVGLLTGRGRGGQPPLYDLAELEPLAEAYHRRKKRRAEHGSSK